jgi:hypothetical protein
MNGFQNRLEKQTYASRIFQKEANSVSQCIFKKDSQLNLTNISIETLTKKKRDILSD